MTAATNHVLSFRYFQFSSNSSFLFIRFVPFFPSVLSRCSLPCCIGNSRRLKRCSAALFFPFRTPSFSTLFVLSLSPSLASLKTPPARLAWCFFPCLPSSQTTDRSRFQVDSILLHGPRPYAATNATQRPHASCGRGRHGALRPRHVLEYVVIRRLPPLLSSPCKQSPLDDTPLATTFAISARRGVAFATF